MGIGCGNGVMGIGCGNGVMGIGSENGVMRIGSGNGSWGNGKWGNESVQKWRHGVYLDGDIEYMELKMCIYIYICRGM